MESDRKHKSDAKEDRNFYQKPFGDNIDKLPQIDKVSADLADEKKNPSASQSEEITEINETDDRDQKDSTTDWGAENSKTGRNK